MKRASFASLFVFSLVTLSGGLALDQQIAGAEEDIVLNIAEGVEIEELLKTVSKATGQPLIWDPSDKQIRGKRVMGGLNLKASKSELFSRVRALLTFYELVIIPVGPVDYQTLLVMDARRTSSILKLKAQYVHLTNENLAAYEYEDGLFVTTTIQVEHMKDMRNARNALSRVVTGQNIGNVTEVPDARAFVVTDFAPNVVAVYRLIKEMDQPTPEVPSDHSFQSVSLANANAVEAAMVLTRLFTTSRPAAQRSRPAAPRQAASSIGPKIEADARTNTILVSGKNADVEEVLRAVTVLDQDAPEPEVHAHMLRLSHVPAREAANALVAIIANSRLLWRNQADPRTTPAVVAVDRVNALLISASNSAFEKIRRVVADLDEAAREDAQKAAAKDGDK